MRLSFLTVVSCVALTAVLPATAQSVSPKNPDAPPPAAPLQSKTLPPRAAADMQQVLDALASLGARPIHTGTPTQVRAGPTPTDAVKAVMTARGMSTVPGPEVNTAELQYGSNSGQKARIYRPAGAAARRRPLIIYYHGGGWVIADLDVYDAAPRLLSKELDAVVVSVEYRHAPEFKFPAQHDDAVNAYKWVQSNARSWGVDVSRMAFAGESAGGNLAINTAIAAREARLPMPRAILSVYPIADSRMDLPSRKTNANAKPLSTPDLAWFAHYYSGRPNDVKDPRINLVEAKLQGLPPVTIVSAQIDPLLSDGLNLTSALRRAGVPVMQRTYPGVTHEFFGMGGVVGGAAQANAWAVEQLRPALAVKRR